MLIFTKTLKKGAITGGLSSGKSSVCSFFQEFGAYVVSADEIVHDLLCGNKKIIQEVVQLLGKDILTNNRIDRKKIAQLVFNESKKLKSLENILHPVVEEEIKKQYQLKKDERLKKDEGLPPLFIAEIPLLFETNGDSFFDFSICVVTDIELSKKRFILNKNQTADEFIKREKRQLPLEEKAQKADYVIYNNGSLQDLKQAVYKLYLQITTI